MEAEDAASFAAAVAAWREQKAAGGGEVRFWDKTTMPYAVFLVQYQVSMLPSEDKPKTGCSFILCVGMPARAGRSGGVRRGLLGGGRGRTLGISLGCDAAGSRAPRRCAPGPRAPIRAIAGSWGVCPFRHNSTFKNRTQWQRRGAEPTHPRRAQKQQEEQQQQSCPRSRISMSRGLGYLRQPCRWGNATCKVSFL